MRARTESLALLACCLALALAAGEEKLDMCQRCACSGGKVDCAGRDLEQHMNQTVWEGIIDVREFLMDHSGIVHLRKFPLFGAHKLSLKHNAISKIDNGCFRMVTNLTEIDLSYNHLTTHSLNPHVFRGSYSPEGYEPLTNLKVLRLSGNILHSLRSDIFEHLPNLRELHLNSNPFKTLDQSTSLAIASVYYLEVLDLSGCSMSSFPSRVLHTPKFLKVLNFSSNHFTKVPEAIQETHSLEEFVMDNNKITILRSFPKVETLKVLKMRYNPVLRAVGKQALGELTRLEELHLCHNPNLREVNEDALMKLPEGEEETRTWPLIKKLYLNHNDLAYLDIGLVSRWDRLEEIDIQMNPWVCDCENQWFLTTLIPQANRTNPSLTNGILCNEPKELQDEPMYSLSARGYKMRCLDAYGNEPEKDGSLLVSIFICVLILIPIAMAAIVILSYRLHRHQTTSSFSYKNINQPSTP